MRALLLAFGFLLLPPSGCLNLALAHEGKLHIVITGDRYTDADAGRFSQKAALVKITILAAEPFTSYADSIDFQTLFNTAPLNCQYSATITRLLTCPVSTVTGMVNAAGLSYDTIIVLVKSGTYGGSGGTISVSYDGDKMPSVVLHEFGHAFGGLLDEYKLSSTNGNVSNQIIANCYTGTTPTTPEWLGWALTCKYPNWSRQKAVKADGSLVNSVMKSLSYKLFSPVAQERIHGRLEQMKQSL